MNKDMFNLSGRNGQTLFLAVIVLGIVAGIVIMQMTEKGLWVMLYTLLIAVGVYFLMTLPFVDSKDDFAPSSQSFNLVWGAVLTVLGSMLLISVYTKIDLWLMIVIPLAVIAILAILMMMRGSK